MLVVVPSLQMAPPPLIVATGVISCVIITSSESVHPFISVTVTVIVPPDALRLELLDPSFLHHYF